MRNAGWLTNRFCRFVKKWGRRSAGEILRTMNLLRELPFRDAQGHVQVVVESPGGSPLKLKYEPDHHHFVWSRALPSGLSFPHDYGFIPQTLSGDGEALDALVYATVPSFPGVIIPGRPIGALLMEQTRNSDTKRNDRIIVIPKNDHSLAHVRNIEELATRVQSEIQAFFTASLALTGKNVRCLGWAQAEEAEAFVDAAHREFVTSATEH